MNNLATVSQRRSLCRSFAQSLILTGSSAGFGHESEQASSTTRAGISGIAGNTEARTGDTETGLQRIFNAERIQRDIDAQAQITQRFGQEAPKAVATYAQEKMDDLKAQIQKAQREGDYDKAQSLAYEIKQWDEGGAYRVALHTAAGALAGGAQGALGAAATASAADLLNAFQGKLKDSLEEAGASTKEAQAISQLIASLTATGIGAAASVGAPMGAAMGLNIDANNRQLHPTEAQLIRRNAEEYAKRRGGISLEQAEAELTQQALQNIDSAWDARLGSDNPQAQAFLEEIGQGQTLIDAFTGQSYQLFAADEATRDNHAQFAQYLKVDAAIRTELDQALSQVHLPKDAQALDRLGLSGSDLALNDAARDYSHMKDEPPQVQWAVLAQLRQTRAQNQGEVGALAQELSELAFTPENVDRRGEILQQLDTLTARDRALLSATQQQILVMGGASLLSPLNQRETFEGYGAARASAGLNLKGINALGSRMLLTKEAIAEAKALAEVEKAIAKAELELRLTTQAPEADFAGRIPVRPKDGAVPSGTEVTETPLGRHLIEAQALRSQVSGGHNMKNFEGMLDQIGGYVVDRVEIVPGIYQVEYAMPGRTYKGGDYPKKTVYDPAKFSDKQMADMAAEAAGRAIIEYQRTGIDKQVINVNGINFFVPIRVPKNNGDLSFGPNNSSQPYVPTVYPIGGAQGAVK